MIFDVNIDFKTFLFSSIGESPVTHITSIILRNRYNINNKWKINSRTHLELNI